MASASGGANALWLTEWLAESMNLRPGMRVLDPSGRSRSGPLHRLRSAHRPPTSRGAAGSPDCVRCHGIHEETAASERV